MSAPVDVDGTLAAVQLLEKCAISLALSVDTPYAAVQVLQHAAAHLEKRS